MGFGELTKVKIGINSIYIEYPKRITLILHINNPVHQWMYNFIYQKNSALLASTYTLVIYHESNDTVLFSIFDM